MKLVDALRCPYCARVRIALAEKGIEHEVTLVDLSDRPQWLVDLNPPYGRVPVLDGLPESGVIMELLEEIHPDPALLPLDPAARARARVMVHRFDSNLGDDYYAFRRGDPNDFAAKLEALDVGDSLFADIAYLPWVIRARDLLSVELPRRIADWLAELERRPSVAAEVEIVRGL
ncbi:MAG TPA: glutathione S-transferase family protein [Gaiellaceae bacterium]|nr:glutathione S-transferase family protein [Gaiellaceae bacterium]